MGTYSFSNIEASINGPGLASEIGSSAGDAKEGITTNFDEDKTTTTTGSDGSIMHSLHAGQTGTWTVRMLKTSPTNSVLNQAYNFQRQSGATWGQNNLRLVDKVNGDVVTLRQAAFVKHPDNVYGEDGNVLEWTFRGVMNELLGSSTPGVNNP